MNVDFLTYSIEKKAEIPTQCMNVIVEFTYAYAGKRRHKESRFRPVCTPQVVNEDFVMELVHRYCKPTHQNISIHLEVNPSVKVVSNVLIVSNKIVLFRADIDLTHALGYYWNITP